jgi:hypothetical protein
MDIPSPVSTPPSLRGEPIGTMPRENFLTPPSHPVDHIGPHTPLSTEILDPATAQIPELENVLKKLGERSQTSDELSTTIAEKPPTFLQKLLSIEGTGGKLKMLFAALAAWLGFSAFKGKKLSGQDMQAQPTG